MKLKKIALLAPLMLCLFIMPPSCKKANPKVRVEMEDGGVFVLELYPEYAPATVKNFTGLVEKGFYDSLTFHRIVDGFMAQGGCPEGTGRGSSGTNIKGEFTDNGFKKNTLKHTRGVISMARSQHMDSASCQFFIMLGDVKGLDGSYAAFGKVVEGMDVVEDFQKIERTLNEMREVATPVKPVVIKSMTIVK